MIRSSTQHPALRRSDLALALFVVAIAAMLLVPLPTTVIDILIVVNLAVAFLLLLAGLYMPNALALLSFPTLLLLTTLFRLSLNVASTRLILSQGDAGDVIRAFGSFLIRGEIVVGIIIFCIITIVNFIVIAKGSSRVSEVAARFALDALPGKQMAIDADVRAGMISPEVAQKRREDLRKESQLYGAMDGAMKFVQGDAIAGFFIIFTNIVGGIYLGLSNGQSFSEAVRTYSVLTVGDGLVSQIPALLISICAGIVVTRISSSDDASLGTDVGSDLFSRPSTLVLAGVLLFFIGTWPGLPLLPFALIGGMLLGGAFILRRFRPLAEGETATLPEFPSLAPALTGGVGDEDYRDENSLMVVLDQSILFRLYTQDSERYEVWWRELQSDAISEMGIRIPDARVVGDDQLGLGQYRVLLNGTEILRGCAILDSIVVEVHPENAGLLGVEVSHEIDHPRDGTRIVWGKNTASVRRVLDAARVRYFDFFEFIGLNIGVFLQKHPEEVVSIAQIHAAFKNIEKRYPSLASVVTQREFLNIARLTEVVRELARDGVNVRDVRAIVEGIAAYCSQPGSAGLGAEDYQLEDVVAFLRTVRRRQLRSASLSYRQTLKVITLGESAQTALAESEAYASGISTDPRILARLKAQLHDVLDPLRFRGFAPICILCRAELRYRLALFLRSVAIPIGVLTYEELDSEVMLESVGVWSLTHD